MGVHRFDIRLTRQFLTICVLITHHMYGVQCSNGIQYTSEAVADEVLNVPNLHGNVTFRHFSGYLDTSDGNMLHYWFFESSRSPSNDPVVLWLNGGPGCSSMHGLLAEHGPFHVQENLDVHVRYYAWNRLANMVYIESPAGVGFSYNKFNRYQLNDSATAKSNFLALQAFFKRFPAYKSNDFYITGESFAAVYLTTLGIELMKDPSILLKGIAIGNGILDYAINFNSLIPFAYYHGYFSSKFYNNITRTCCDGDICKFYNSRDTACRNNYNQAFRKVFSSGLNRYDLYQDCVDKKFKYGNDNVEFSASHAFMTAMAYKSFSTPPCYDDTKDVKYLRLPQVRQALHIHSQAMNWTLCRTFVQRTYRVQTFSSYKLLPTLLGKYRILIFFGDSDGVCNYLGGQWVMKTLGLKPLTPYAPWHVTNQNGRQIAGYKITYPNLHYVTIKGAGHLVPEDKPHEAFVMMQTWFNDKTTTSALISSSSPGFVIAVLFILVTVVIELLF